jgi:hypothetical protein
MFPPARRFVDRGMEADDQTWRMVAMERGLWLPCIVISATRMQCSAALRRAEQRR